jgi:hypothetical protein
MASKVPKRGIGRAGELPAHEVPYFRRNLEHPGELPAHVGQLLYPDYALPDSWLKQASRGDPVYSGLLSRYGLQPGGRRWKLLQPEPPGKLPQDLPCPVPGLPRWRLP